MEIRLIFDEKSSMYFNGNNDYNLMWLIRVKAHIEDMLRFRGYMYLNQIYDLYGLRWNLENENPYLIFNPQKNIEIDYNKIDSGYEITIKY